jgi:hypothetical protein
MGNNLKIVKKCTFEDIQLYIKKKKTNAIVNCVLIHTLQTDSNSCLIEYSQDPNDEVRIINQYIQQKKTNVPIIIYGENTNDIRVIEKYQKLASFGFDNIFIYIGGLFEWLCLQDIYGDDEFPTKNKELDILKYRPKSVNGSVSQLFQSTNIQYIQDVSHTESNSSIFSTIKNLLL